uniref:Putative ovule protein n=1 Tax=Solanum chacoense TaxID=4108 RepID=A0A0V0H4M6_SOLCH
MVSNDISDYLVLCLFYLVEEVQLFGFLLHYSCFSDYRHSSLTSLFVELVNGQYLAFLCILMYKN